MIEDFNATASPSPEEVGYKGSPEQVQRTVDTAFGALAEGTLTQSAFNEVVDKLTLGASKAFFEGRHANIATLISPGLGVEERVREGMRQFSATEYQRSLPKPGIKF